MKHALLRYLYFPLVWLALSFSAHAQIQAVSWFEGDNITVCPAKIIEVSPPDFSEDKCETVSPSKVDPQSRMIWVKTKINLDAIRGPKGEPLSLYISGKMSSEAYLNGEFVGQNGVVGEDAKSEIVGKMDAEFFPRQDLFLLGENEIIFRASSQNGILHLHSPLHMVAIAPSGVFGNRVFPEAVPALVTLSLFLMGALYFGVMAVIASTRISFLTLSLICVFAGAQLLFETMRGLISYDYTIHDYRLLGITACSTAFGLSVAFHIFRTFKMPKLLWTMVGLIGFTLFGVFAIKGFDLKALSLIHI